MPKMKLEYDIELNDILKDLGVKRIFSPFDAELHGISPDDIYVSLVKQFSYINVDEAGSVAAAVTEADYVCAAFGDDVTPDYVEFNMNRPFVYIIRDTQKGTILFMGRVMNL
jgi:serpin B